MQKTSVGTEWISELWGLKYKQSNELRKLTNGIDCHLQHCQFYDNFRTNNACLPILGLNSEDF